MKLLLDTHIWLRWLLPESDPLPDRTASLIEDAADLAVSAISRWVTSANTYLVKRGRLILHMSIEQSLPATLEGSNVACLPLDGPMAARAAALADIHRDPADRFIIATAIVSNRRLLTLDSTMPTYPELRGQRRACQRPRQYPGFRRWCPTASTVATPRSST